MNRAIGSFEKWIVKIVGVVASVVVVVGVVYAVKVPNTFVDGNVASAKQVNDNFKYLADRIFEPSFGTTTMPTVAISVGDCTSGTKTLMSFSLPLANATYMVTYHVRVILQNKLPSPLVWIKGQILEKQTSKPVPYSELILIGTSIPDKMIQTTSSMSVTIKTTKANQAYELVGCRSGNGTWVTSNVLSNTAGRTKIVYHRVK